DHLIDLLERQHAHHRAEDLVAGDGHVVGDVIEDGRLHEEAPATEPVSAGHELGALALPQLHVAENLVHLLLGYLRPLFGAWLQRVADLALPRQLGEALNKVAVNLLLDEEPAAGGAALAAVEIDRVERTGEGGA